MRSLLPQTLSAPVIGAALTLSIGVFGPELFHKYMPMAYWSWYYSVEPVTNIVKIGEPLLFKSKREVRRPVVLKWDDMLRCKIGDDDYPPFSTSTPFARYVNDSTGKVEEVLWAYKGKLPAEPTTCFLQPTITQYHSGGIARPQHLTERHYIEFIK